jgi:hypothetical protein
MGAEENSVLPEPAAIEFAGADDARLFFSGPPRRLTGTIPLVNNSSAKQNLRAISVSAGDLRGVAQLPLREFPFAARLYPGEQAAIRGSIALDSGTPPGTYEIEVQIGSKTVPATVYVTEVVDLRAEPSVVTILAGSASSYTRTMIVQNLGNVPLPSGSRCETPIFDSFDTATSMLIGLRKADRKSVETMTKGVLDEWAELQAGTLVISREPMVLRPGQKAVVDLEFQLPPELKPLRHYRTSIELYNAVVAVDIYTTAKIGGSYKKKSD